MVSQKYMAAKEPYRRCFHHHKKNCWTAPQTVVVSDFLFFLFYSLSEEHRECETWSDSFPRCFCSKNTLTAEEEVQKVRNGKQHQFDAVRGADWPQMALNGQLH